MPVQYCESNGKYRIGEGDCVYDTEEDAEEAQQAYYAQQEKMKKEQINICNTKIAKSVDEEKRIFKCVVLRPDEFDNDGIFSDTYSKEVVEKACHDFMLYCNQANLDHSINTDSVKFVENAIADVDYILGDGEVKAGDWVAAIKVFDDTVWEKCKKGEYTGFSIGCMASVEYIDEVE